MTSSRPYELVLLGATGYTGTLTAEYIQEHVATDLKWAIAGRNSKRLHEIAEMLKKLNPNRIQPVVEVVELKGETLDALVAKTKVVMTTVGPYSRFGEPVVASCVKNGTHYLDVTGEAPFTWDMMNKYHEAAKAKGVCIVPHCGVDSVPADLSAYLCAKAAQTSFKNSLQDCICSLQKMSGGPSGGTSHTVLTIIETYPLSHLAKSMAPKALCPIAPPKGKPSTNSFLSKLLGYRSVPDLGVLTSSLQAGSDIGIVYRSWGLFDSGNFYGSNFTFSEFMRARNPFTAAAFTYFLNFAMIALYLAPFRWLLRKIAPVQGTGPSKEDTAKSVLTYKTVATVDEPQKRRVFSSLHYPGALYYVTGIFLTEAALVLSRGGDVLGKRLGGMITPATLEIEYVERLQKAGVELKWGVLSQ